MAASIATVTGTALVPGVSRNKRLYSPELIGKAVSRAQQRLAEGGLPLTMRTSHPKSGEESTAPVTEIVGRITRIWQEADGRARFTADVADTKHGRDVANLVDNRQGEPYLRGVSIRGGWLGRVSKVMTPDGGLAETADDLEVDGLDYTANPGVVGAGVEQVTDPDGAPREAGPDGRTPITESVQEALVETIVEATAPPANKEPYGDVVYADPGYQKDKKKRYPLSDKKKAKAAWSYINAADNARLYTAAQLKRIRQRIIKALKGYGVTVDVKEGWLIDPVSRVTETVAESMGMDYDQPGSLCINLTNGPVCVSVSAYCIDPHDLDAIGRAAMAGACQALTTIDPDLDGDIDVPGADAEDTDEDMGESAPVVAEAAPVEPDPTQTAAPVAETTETPAPEPVADPTTEEEVLAVSEPTTQAVVPAPAAAELSDAAIDKLADKLGGALAQAFARFAPAPVAAPAEAAPAPVAAVVETAPAAPVVPAPVAVVESDDQRIARLVAEQVETRMAGLTQQIQESVQRNGPPTRKGLVGRVAESGELTTTGGTDGELNSNGLPSNWPDKPLHQYTSEERLKYMSPAMMNHVVGHRL